jgi:hypothetical protein
MAVDTLFLCFLEDLERNDGTPERPYYMSKYGVEPGCPAVNAPTPPVFRIQIRIHRIHIFLGLPYSEPFVGGMDPDPSIILLS